MQIYLGFPTFFRYVRSNACLPDPPSFFPSPIFRRDVVAEGLGTRLSLLRLILKCSKTDQPGKGVDIYIGKTGDDICPVAAVLSFFAIRGMEPGPLFVCRDSTPCTKARFIPNLRSALQAGWPKLCRTQLPHRSRDHPGGTRHRRLRLSKPWGDGTAPPFWLTYACLRNI